MMDVVMDTPGPLRTKQLDLARKITRIAKKVQAQSLIRHPDDWGQLVDALEESSAELEELLDEIKKLPHNQH
jgi:hypothetical protein